MRSTFFILFSAIILFSCSNEPDRKENASVKVNDVSIVYDQCGNGDTTLLFVHGW